MGEETPTSPPERGARVGVRDVARAAGVSPQTVSRVLNGHANIRDDTRARVREAVSALGYRMNNAARALGTATTRTLGVVASAPALYGPSAGIAAIEAAARARGRWVATAYADAADAASVVAAVHHLLSQGVDGIVLVAAHALTRDAVAQARPGVPVVVLHEGSGARRQEEGAALAVRHLVGLGHRRIAELAGPEDWTEAAARSRGVACALGAEGLAAAASWTGDWSAAAGFAVATAVAAAVATADGPTAVVAANDQMALGLMAGLHARGVDVPGRVSVTGFDDNPDAAFYRPALTTVRLDLDGEAHRVVADVVGDPPAPPAPPRLVRRASTAPPPRSRTGDETGNIPREPPAPADEAL
ncbi:LacI family transcriptional regulator [Microbacterium sp. dk485]|uniref:LacI family DNA-binding transcriptional regulator n=1 Tax=Microbacterium sp. dk485 TaxID=2560021 RepID=UPI001074424C|nr:LacI family DNA-binding transcriptional regulator [Microbacterium sp. dk485]TFV85218.1 LacI family transcriptional regulator [Microbacterium sp. dk485]